MMSTPTQVKSRYRRPCTTMPRTPSAIAAITKSRNKMAYAKPWLLLVAARCPRRPKQTTRRIK